jgi:prefoldin subunit 5
MAQQIKKKFIGADQIDGSKIKLLEGQSIRGTNSLGQEVDLVKLGSEDKVEVLGQEVALKSALDQEILDRQSGDASTLSSAQSYADGKIADLVNSAPEVLDTLKELADALGGDANFAATVAGQIGAVDAKVDQEILDRQSAISQEILDRQAADAALQSQIDALDGNFVTEAELAAAIVDLESQIDDVDGYAQEIRSDLDNLDGYAQEIRSDLDQEVIDRAAGDASTLSSAQSYTDQKVADLVNSAPEVLDTLKELSDALGGDANFAATVAGQIGDLDGRLDIIEPKVSSLESQASSLDDRLDTIEPKVSTLESEMDAVQAELISLDSRVDALEDSKEIIEIDSLGSAPTLGLEGKIYVAKDSNRIYRWAMVGGGELSFDLVVGAGEAYASLQDALIAAVDGQNILVKAGTYLVSSAINVTKQVKIVGEDKDLVIFETAASTSAPTTMFNVSANNVALAKMTIKHKKTSNTSVETAVVASGGGFPQTRISNFIMESCNIEFIEFGMTVRAEDWCVRDSQFTYATGSVSNSCRAIGIYGTKGNAFIKDNFLKNDVLNGTAFRPFYLTSTTGTNPNETVEGKLVLEGTTHVGPLAQFWNQDNQQGSAGSFELQIKNNITNESNLFAGFAAAVANSGDMFSSITLSGNTISNLHAVDGGKGVFGVYGTAAFRTSALIVHASNNTLGQEIYRTGWVSVEGTTVGRETGTPSFSVSLDSVIPESGEAPSIIPSGSSAYVELSPEPDLSEIESDIDSLQSADVVIDSRLEVLEAKGYAKGVVTVGEELSFIDLDRQYSVLLSVAVGRLMVHEGEDFTVSIVGGKTRLTWIGSLVNPGGEEAIESGDKVFFSGAF